MNTASPSPALQSAIARLVWRRSPEAPWWERLWIGPLVLGLGLAAMTLQWPAQAPIWGAIFGLVCIATLWWTVVVGLLRQNRPTVAQLVPGQATALRTALLLQGAIAAAAAFALLAALFGPRLEWLWWIVPALLFGAWAVREPWLWALTLFAGLLPWRRLAQAGAALPWEAQALALAAALIGLAAVIGQGGRLHRWHEARCRRWRQAALAAREGRAPSIATQGPALRPLLRSFDWLARLWLRRQIARGAASPWAARLDIGLGLGGQWAVLLWVALLLFGGIGSVLVLLALRGEAVDFTTIVDRGRYGMSIGTFAMVTSPLYERLSRLWSRRREQALLALLPGMQAEGLAPLEARWRRQYLLAWALATAALLALASFGSAESLRYVAACAALNLPLIALAEWQQRRIRARPRVWMLAAAAPVAALLALPTLVLPVPAALSLGLSILITAWLLRRRDRVALRWPVGRQR